MGRIELSYVTITYVAPIVYYKYSKDIELGFPEIKELVTCAELLSGGKPYVTLADVRNGISITAQGRRYAADLSRMPLFRGTAVLVKNSMLSIAGNIMIDIVKKKYPYKIFTKMESAEQWLAMLPLDELLPYNP